MDQAQTYSNKSNNALIFFFISLIIFVTGAAVSFFLYKSPSNFLELSRANLETVLEQNRNSQNLVADATLSSSELLTDIIRYDENFKNNVAQSCSAVEKIAFCFYKAGVVFNDPDLCSLAGGVDLRDECYMSIAIETKKSDLCERVGRADNQIRCLAATTNDPSLCQQITDTLRQTYCLQDIASTQETEDVCKLLPYDSDYNRNICYSQVARRNKDVSYCDIICDEPVDQSACDSSRIFWKDSCYMKVGIVSKDEGICSQISRNDEKNYCLALVKKDVSYCSKILIDESYKYNCDIITKTDEPVDYDSLFGP